MDSAALIHALVHQTTVLIAQLSTALGIRAPLAHLADQVFLELAREIESRGVGRKVVADMFGLALRTYQKKVNRLEESLTEHDRTLWEVVLEFIQQRGTVTRDEVFAHFDRDDELSVGAMLNDLVSSGFVFKTGRGPRTTFGVTDEEIHAEYMRAQNGDARDMLVWVATYRRQGATLSSLAEYLRMPVEGVEQSIASLMAQGNVHRVVLDGVPRFHARTFIVPVGARKGWEAAVFDHFQALVNAVSTKVRMGRTQSRADDVVGGATLSFDVYRGHPYEEVVYGLLERVRREINEVWEQVVEENLRHPIPEDDKIKVSFYFGQNVRGAEALFAEMAADESGEL